MAQLTVTAAEIDSGVAYAEDLKSRKTPAEIEAGVSKANKLFTGQYTAVAWGDSITNQGSTEDATNTNYTNIGYFNWANIALNQTFELLNEAGVSGETTAEILARFSSDVAPFNPNYVFILAGTNDCIQGLPLATITANITSMINSCHTIGAKVVIGTIPATSNINTAPNQELLYNVNRFIRNCNADFIVDYASALLDVNATTFPAVFENNYYDGLHPNVKGAYLMGLECANSLSNIQKEIPFFPANSLDLLNAVINPLNRGAGGTVVAGVAPNDVTVFVSGSVPVGSSLTGSVIENSLGNERTFRLTATGSTEFQTFTRYSTKVPVAGKKYIAYMKIKNCTATNLEELSLKVRTRDGSTTQHTYYSMRPWAVVGVIPEFILDEGVIATPIIETDANTDAFILDVFWTMEAGVLEIEKLSLMQID